MNTKIRHLVLNPSNQPQRPCDHGLNLAGVQSDKSPSFLDLAVAKKFAALLARKDKGTTYYVATVNSMVESFDELDDAGASSDGESVQWADATA